MKAAELLLTEFRCLRPPIQVGRSATVRGFWNGVRTKGQLFHICRWLLMHRCKAVCSRLLGKFESVNFGSLKCLPSKWLQQSSMQPLRYRELTWFVCHMGAKRGVASEWQSTQLDCMIWVVDLKELKLCSSWGRMPFHKEVFVFAWVCQTSSELQIPLAFLAFWDAVCKKSEDKKDGKIDVYFLVVVDMVFILNY